jgi:hypothetical protein
MAPFVRILWPVNLTQELEAGGRRQLLYGWVIDARDHATVRSRFVGCAVLGAAPGPCDAKGARKLAEALRSLQLPSPCPKWLVQLTVVGVWAPHVHGATSGSIMSGACRPFPGSLQASRPPQGPPLSPANDARRHTTERGAAMPCSQSRT